MNVFIVTFDDSLLKK